jgi:hypothetical protein
MKVGSEFGRGAGLDDAGAVVIGGTITAPAPDGRRGY